MRTLISRTIGSEISPRMSIGADEIYRPLIVGNNWNKLRIGLSLSLTSSGANYQGTPRLFVGVCTRYKSWGSWNAHAYGLVQTAATPPVSAGPPNSYNMTMTPVQVIGQTETSIGGNAGIVLTGNPATTRHYYFVGIDKTGGTLRMTHFTSTNTVSGIYDISPVFARDLTEMDTPTASSFNSGSFSTTASLNEATNGPLDCVNIGWSMTNYPLEINEITVAYNL
jgi:hypothetical protein